MPGGRVGVLRHLIGVKPVGETPGAEDAPLAGPREVASDTPDPGAACMPRRACTDIYLGRQGSCLRHPSVKPHVWDANARHASRTPPEPVARRRHVRGLRSGAPCLGRGHRGSRRLGAPSRPPCLDRPLRAVGGAAGRGPGPVRPAPARHRRRQGRAPAAQARTLRRLHVRGQPPYTQPTTARNSPTGSNPFPGKARPEV